LNLKQKKPIEPTAHRNALKQGGGRYGGKLNWTVNPQNITVRRNFGGQASRFVTMRYHRIIYIVSIIFKADNQKKTFKAERLFLIKISLLCIFCNALRTVIRESKILQS
jgi:hypothetical protein